MNSLNFLSLNNFQVKQNFKYVKHLQNVFKSIFDVIVSNTQVSIEEKRLVAMKIKELIPILDNFVFSLGNQFDPNRGPFNLILRSGIQFLLDELKNWPVDVGSLEPHLKVFEEGDSLETFDKALQQWKDGPPSLAIDVIIYTSVELTRPNHVPMSHTWWY